MRHRFANKSCQIAKPRSMEEELLEEEEEEEEEVGGGVALVPAGM